MIIHYYSDFNVMFQHFLNGEIDISDWPLQSQNDINTFCSNADLFCTSAQESLGYFGLELNSHSPFMGMPLTTSRTVSPPSFTPTTTVGGCVAGFGSLSITLRNQETGSTVLDPLNTLLAYNLPSDSPAQTVSDSGGAAPNGIYNVPCTLAGTYGLLSSVYNATGVSVTVASATATSGILNVNWNSPSNVTPTQARALLGAAVAHLLDDPVFVSSYFGTLAEAPCAYAVLTQGITCPTQAQIDSAECQFGNHAWLAVCGGTAGPLHDTSQYNIVADAIGGSTEWWNTGGSGVGVAQGYSGALDLQAACDDFVSMGLTLTPSGATCAQVAAAASATTDPGTYPHIVPAGAGHIIDYVRVNNGRTQFGQIIADTLDFLFGTPMDRSGNVGFVGTVCYGACPQYTVRYYTLAQITPMVLEDTPVSGGSADSWQLYTADQSFNLTPDQYFLHRNSLNTGSICSLGKPRLNPSNYDFWCDPQTDADSVEGEVASTPAQSNVFFQRALIDELNKAVDIPGFTFVSQFVENNGFNFQQCTGSPCVNTQSSIVNTVGFGTQAGSAYFTLLNGRQVPGYNPCSVPGAPSNCASYVPGGGNPNLIRRGFSQDTSNFSPFTFNSVWEKEVLSDIFDTMLKQNPDASGGTAQFIDWGTTKHTVAFNGKEVGCNPINGCVTGVTTQIWYLRNDWRFSDGDEVTANDTAYSILAYRDVPSGPLQPYVANVVSAKGLDCGRGQPCKTLQVKLQGPLICGSLNLSVPCLLSGMGTTQAQSKLFDLLDFNIGANLYILEKSLWAPYCGDPPVPGGICASASFDPMYPSGNSPGIEVGAGPWSCVAPISGAGVMLGHIGGPCAETSTGALTGGAITTDGRILLSENTNFARCCPNGLAATSSSLYKISYADLHKTGVVDITDLADIGSRYGTADPYWCNPNIACTSGVVGAVNLATVAIYFGHGINGPTTTFGRPPPLVGIDPQIDPFFCTPTGAAIPPSIYACA
jgi:hypothetical protein